MDHERILGLHREVQKTSGLEGKESGHDSQSLGCSRSTVEGVQSNRREIQALPSRMKVS